MLAEQGCRTVQGGGHLSGKITLKTVQQLKSSYFPVTVFFLLQKITANHFPQEPPVTPLFLALPSGAGSFSFLFLPPDLYWPLEIVSSSPGLVTITPLLLRSLSFAG